MKVTTKINQKTAKRILLICLLLGSVFTYVPSGFTAEIPNPNQFKGTDTERIQAAIQAAKGTSNKIIIPAANGDGTYVWKIDSAILLPSDMTVILENCTLQLTNESRDNIFRSDNVGEGITNPVWNKNIHIIGVGKVLLKGADNPRSTGDGRRQLTLDPAKEAKNGNWRVSYGTDAAKSERKQTGDWRNIMILIGYVKGFTLTNVSIENSHCWAISFERTWHAELTNIRMDNRDEIEIAGKMVAVSNKDGIDLRQGCKYFRIDNVSGYTGDDFIALSNLGPGPEERRPHGSINSTMVTASTWFGPEDDIEQITITNVRCANRYRAVAIRATGQAGINHVYIDGLSYEAIDGKHEAMLLGGAGYGAPSLPGKINNIYMMNMIGTGLCLVRIESAVENCQFMNGIYKGKSASPFMYTIDEEKPKNIVVSNVSHINE